MVAHGFVHCEVLGPRASLDRWLGTLQDLGVCHLADALHELEGRPGIGRPVPTLNELTAEMVRSEAATGLRAVARVLPATPAATGPRPRWELGPGEAGGGELRALREEARSITARLRAQLDHLRQAEENAEVLDARRAALEALLNCGEGTVAGSLWWIRTGGRRSARRVERWLKSQAHLSVRGRGERSDILLQRASTEPDALAREAAQALGARWLPFPRSWLGRRVADVRTEAELEWLSVRRAESEAQDALGNAVRELGPRGRLLLDSLQDAERRQRARHLLASTQHVVAARLYVRREDEARLHDRLAADQGDHVLVRTLAEADDVPTLPRRIASAPLGVLEGLRPARLRDLSLAAVLAVAAPLATAWAWADVAGGVFLLLAGALLGRRDGSEVGAPRRDTALLAQLAGLCALVSGLWHGSALGHGGVLWFGTDWGWGAGAAITGPWDALTRLFAALGWVTLALGVYALALTLAALRQGGLARAGALAATLLRTVAISALLLWAAASSALATSAAGLGVAHGVLAWITIGLFAGVLLIDALAGRLALLLLDGVGVLRLCAVGGATLLVFDLVTRSWAEGSAVGFVLGPPAVLLAALAAVVDPAHLAMGVPYDLAFGARSPRQPFEPFARQLRRGEEA